MNIKRLSASMALGAIILGSFTAPALAAPPVVGTSPAAPNAQCGTGAASGAFNFSNQVYGPNSREFGKSGGAVGSHGGAVGQEDGAAGYLNSHVCP